MSMGLVRANTTRTAPTGAEIPCLRRVTPRRSAHGMTDIPSILVVPDAMQHAVMLRWSGTSGYAAWR